MAHNLEYTRPKLYKYQTQILDSPARFTVTEASTKTGKTASHIVWLFEEALKIGAGQNVWWVAPVYGQAEIAFSRMRRQISERDFFKVNESKLRLTTPTGSIIGFKTAEKPDNLFGDDVFAAVFDEFTRARQEAWFALRSTLTATRGKCKFIGNVKGKKNWGYQMAQKAKAGDDPDYQYFKITAYDAAAEGLLSLEEIEQAKRDLPESVFKELYLAEPADDGTNPFGITHIAQCTFPLAPGPAVCYGIDLAKSVDWTVIIGLNISGNVCYLDRFRKDWKQTTETIVALPRAPMLVDSTGVGDPVTEELQNLIPDVTGFKYNQFNKQQIMLGLAADIQKRRTTFPPGPIVDELESFEFVYTSTGVKYSAPEGFHDDCVNALALARKHYNDGNYTRPGRYSFI